MSCSVDTACQHQLFYVFLSPLMLQENECESDDEELAAAGGVIAPAGDAQMPLVAEEAGGLSLAFIHDWEEAISAANHRLADDCPVLIGYKPFQLIGMYAIGSGGVGGGRLSLDGEVFSAEELFGAVQAAGGSRQVLDRRLRRRLLSRVYLSKGQGPKLFIFP
jgi:hypothetical protein